MTQCIALRTKPCGLRLENTPMICALTDRHRHTENLFYKSNKHKTKLYRQGSENFTITQCTVHKTRVKQGSENFTITQCTDHKTRVKQGSENF